MSRVVSQAAGLARVLKAAGRTLTLGLDLKARKRAIRYHYAPKADIPIDIGCVEVFRAENFPDSKSQPWLDQPDALVQVERRLARRKITAKQAEICRFWHEHGYYVARGAIDPATIDATWAAYEDAITRGDLILSQEKAADDDLHPGRSLNPHQTVGLIDDLLKNPALLDFCSLVLGRKAIPFQTIASHKGSQQSEHSDSIHMTTYPLGYLAACWVAMEDIHVDSGPLVYYPGSHRWPYVFSHDVGISPSDFQEKGYAAYAERYEPAMRRAVEEHDAQKQHFIARKGDVLFWHANLVHGGSPRNAIQHSRKALVHHYFAEGCICYHDLAASASAVHGPTENFPVCGASDASVVKRASAPA